MRVVIQRTKKAAVAVEGKEISSIDEGLMVLLGIEDNDTDEDVQWLCAKIVNLRIFDDEQGVMNESILQNPGMDILLVSQFTLFASTKKATVRRTFVPPNPILPCRCMRNSSPSFRGNWAKR